MGTPTHFKIVFRGIFAGTPEGWSFGAHWSRDGDLEQDADVGDIDQSAVTDAINQLFNPGTEATIGSHVQCTEWRAYRIGEDGKMFGNPLLVPLTPTINGGSGGAHYPPQIALAITTVAANRGPARLGRFYLPGPQAALGGDLRLSVAAAAAYRETATAFTKAVADAIDFPLSTEGSSLLNISDRPAPGGTKQIVDHIEVGRVYDTLRNRRKSLLEDRDVGGTIDW